MKHFLALSLFLFAMPSLLAQDKNYEAVIRQLLEIDQLDQLYRNQIDGVEAKYGRKSPEIITLFTKMKEADSINLIQVESIIQKYGWLGYAEIGTQANSAIFMVIQHSDLKTQQKYLPVMREAVKNKKAKPQSFAMLEDRIAVYSGKKQIYGSQILWSEKHQKYFVVPLEDPENVDQRRAAVGLPPLGEYISAYDITWDLKKYITDLPEIESELKIMLHKQ